MTFSWGFIYMDLHKFDFLGKASTTFAEIKTEWIEVCQEN